jgi:hypothetical protein
VLIAHLTLGKIRFNFQAGGQAGYAPDFITGPMLRDKPHYVVDGAGVGWFYLTGNVAEGELVTIGSRVYGFTQLGVVPPGADVLVDVAAGLAPAIAIPALVAAVNGDASRVANLVTLGGNIAGISSIATTATGNIALATNCANGTVRAATAIGGSTAQRRVSQTNVHAISAADVTALAGTLGTSEIVIAVLEGVATPPGVLAIQAYRRAGADPTFTLDPINLAGSRFRLRRVSAAQWILTYSEPAGGALLQADDRVTSTLTYNPATP